MTGQSLESWVLRRDDADGLEAVEFAVPHQVTMLPCMRNMKSLREIRVHQHLSSSCASGRVDMCARIVAQHSLDARHRSH